MKNRTPAAYNAPHAPFYGRSGEPITADEWSQRILDESYCRIGNTGMVVKGEPVRVSTFWMGWCLGPHDYHPPMLFQTSVMGGVFNGACWLFGTEAEALLGHQVAVELARDGAADTEALLRKTEALQRLREDAPVVPA